MKHKMSPSTNIEYSASASKPSDSSGVQESDSTAGPSSNAGYTGSKPPTTSGETLVSKDEEEKQKSFKPTGKIHLAWSDGRLSHSSDFAELDPTRDATTDRPNTEISSSSSSSVASQESSVNKTSDEEVVPTSSAPWWSVFVLGGLTIVGCVVAAFWRQRRKGNEEDEENEEKNGKATAHFDPSESSTDMKQVSVASERKHMIQ